MFNEIYWFTIAVIFTVEFDNLIAIDCKIFMIQFNSIDFLFYFVSIGFNSIDFLCIFCYKYWMQQQIDLIWFNESMVLVERYMILVFFCYNIFFQIKRDCYLAVFSLRKYILIDTFLSLLINQLNKFWSYLFYLLFY